MTIYHLLPRQFGLLCSISLLVAGSIVSEPVLAARGGKGGGGGGGSLCKVTTDTDVAIYIGGGIGPSSQLWAEALIEFWKTGLREPGQPGRLNETGSATWTGDSSLDYVTLTLSEFNACSATDFANLELFFMPGGSAYEIQDNLGSKGKSMLTSFLDGGGNYVGICAGGYFAAKGYYWKGDDGAPTDNCKNQFCRYETAGTFSYDRATSDFTTHEWGGTSYHSNLLAYGPLSNVYVEGPIEEIAGPWHIDSNPNHPYDSHMISTDDPYMPELRVVYWGGATENYIYTENAAWGAEHAHFIADPADNNDLGFPQNNNLWTLKTVATGAGGKIMISSAHVEASLFHTASTFDNGGMTECQQYNNYTYMVKKMNQELGLAFNTPEYDTLCSNNRQGEVKNTASLFPTGLAYQNAPRIDNSGSGGGGSGGDGSGGDGDGNNNTGFDDGTLGAFALSGSAVRPWVADSTVACTGTHAARAGHSGGVDSDSTISIMNVPAGTTSASYQYSYPPALDRGDDFHVIVNGAVIKSYETGAGANCATDSVSVSGGDSLHFRCRSGGKGETCTVDNIIFQ
jgi:hypothetical protein